jgi:quercetin dioxygenase-like cupin family protein
MTSITEQTTANAEDAHWFLGTLAIVKASGETTGGQMAVIEQLAPRGSGSPLHVHHNEDEWFYVIDGELTVWVDGDVSRVPAGGFAFGPRDVPHTFVVSSDRAHFLLGINPAGFEGFLRALAQPAETLTIPPGSDTPPDMELLAKTAAEYNLEILGPPGIPV